MDPLTLFVLAAYGFAVSWIEERFGAFEGLEPRTKQLINSLFSFVVPAVVIWLNKSPWPADFGDPSAVVTALLTLLAPVGVWVASQLAHYLDKWLAKIAPKKGVS